MLLTQRPFFIRGAPEICVRTCCSKLTDRPNNDARHDARTKAAFDMALLGGNEKHFACQLTKGTAGANKHTLLMEVEGKEEVRLDPHSHAFTHVRS